MIKWIFKVLFGCIFFLIACGVIIAGVFFTVNGKEQADQERQFPVEIGEKRVLVLYQDSRLGLTRKAVELVCSSLQDEGFSVTANHPRADSPYDPQNYDIVVLTSPVYACQVSEPLLRFADTQDFTDINVLVLLTGSDLEETAGLDAVKGKIRGANVLSGIKVDRADRRITDALRELIDQ